MSAFHPKRTFAPSDANEYLKGPFRPNATFELLACTLTTTGEISAIKKIKVVYFRHKGATWPSRHKPSWTCQCRSSLPRTLGVTKLSRGGGLAQTWNSSSACLPFRCSAGRSWRWSLRRFRAWTISQRNGRQQSRVIVVQRGAPSRRPLARIRSGCLPRTRTSILTDAKLLASPLRSDGGA